MFNNYLTQTEIPDIFDIS